MVLPAEEVELAKAGYLEARRIARGQDKALAERLVNYLHRNRTLQSGYGIREKYCCFDTGADI